MARRPSVPRGDVHDHVDARMQQVADRGSGHRRAALQHHRLQPAQRVERPVGVHGGQRAVVPGRQGRRAGDGFAATHLADHRAGPAAGRSAARSKIGRATARPRPSAACIARLQPHGVGRAPAAARSCPRSSRRARRLERAERRRSAASSCRTTSGRTPGCCIANEPRRPRGRPRAPAAEGARSAGPRAEAADRQARAVGGDGRHRRTHSRAVGQAGIDDRGHPVEPAAERPQDPLDDAVDLPGREVGRGARAGRRARPRPGCRR